MTIMQSAIGLLHAALGNWWALAILFVLSGVMFGVVVPKAKKGIFAQVASDLPAKVLDEYFLTWTPQQARRFFEDIGPEGRKAYRTFYRRLDFWFPSLVTSLMYCSLLTLAYPPGSGFAWIAPLGLVGWLFDNAENITHFRMARDYPDLSASSLEYGPKFTYWKWVLAVVTPLASLPGFVGQLIAHVQ